MNDLSAKEQEHVRAALRFLRTRCGSYETLSKALGFGKGTASNIVGGRASLPRRRRRRRDHRPVIQLNDPVPLAASRASWLAAERHSHGLEQEPRLYVVGASDPSQRDDSHVPLAGFEPLDLAHGVAGVVGGLRLRPTLVLARHEELLAERLEDGLLGVLSGHGADRRGSSRKGPRNSFRQPD